MNTRAMVLAGVLCAGVGCMPPIRVTTAFSSRFADNNTTTITTVCDRVAPSGQMSAELARPANTLGRPLIAAVIQGEHRAVAVFDVSTHAALWTVPIAARSTPEILGDALVVDTVDGTRIMDLATGGTRATIDHANLDFTGAARDGDAVVLTFSSGLTGNRARMGRVSAVDAQSGHERWSHQIAGLVGRPAARGGLAFVPWDRQSIAVLNMGTGVEQARVRSTDDSLTWVEATPEGVFYGGRGVYRLTPTSASGTRAGSAYIENPIQGVPGDPVIHRDGFLATTGTRTARDKIRFGFYPVATDGGRVGFQDNTVYLGYFRDVLAFDVHTSAVRWAQHLDDDVESLTVTPTGVFSVSGNGKVRAMDPRTGTVSTVTDLGANLGAISVDLGGLAVPPGGRAPEGSIREQLVSLVRDTDNRLVPFRAYLVGLVARLDDEQVTRDLLDLYTQRSIPNQLRQSIATALESRRTGGRFLIAALQEHYDYLEGRQAPPLQVIAPALVAMGAHDAVPGLLAQMLDHETPMASLPAVVTAVATLGQSAVVPALQQWVQLYKSDSTFTGDAVAALAAATDAVFRYGDAASRAWLQRLGRDATASAALKGHVTELFARAAAEVRNRATAATESERQATLQEELNHLHTAQDAVHGQLTEAQIDEVWSDHGDELRACAQGAVTRNPALNQIRVVITLHAELPVTVLARTPSAESPGTDAQHPRHATTTMEALAWVHNVQAALQAQRSRVRLTTYAPNDPELRTCMDRVIQPLEFPSFRGIRQEFHRVIDTRGSRAAAPDAERFNGFGVDVHGREFPWWLVSAPPPEIPVVQPTAPTSGETPQPPGEHPAGALPSSTVAPRRTPVGSPSGAPPSQTTPSAPAGTPPAPTTPAPTTPAPTTPAPTTPAAHPWWEE